MWLEAVPPTHLRRPHITPGVSNGVLRLEQRVVNSRAGLKLRATLRDGNSVVCMAEDIVDLELSPSRELKIPDERRRL